MNGNLSRTLTSKIGGIAGLGSSEAKSVISLEKTRFFPGEKIKVKFDMDNSRCKKPVKSFRIKLSRAPAMAINYAMIIVLLRP